MHDVTSFSMKLIDINRHVTYPLMFFLIKLMFILLVASASVEIMIFFSIMTNMKNKLQNIMGDEVLNDCLVTFIENDVFLQVHDDNMIDLFQDITS